MLIMYLIIFVCIIFIYKTIYIYILILNEELLINIINDPFLQSFRSDFLESFIVVSTNNSAVIIVIKSFRDVVTII